MAVASEESAKFARLSYAVLGWLSLLLLAVTAAFAQRAAAWAKAAALSSDKMVEHAGSSSEAAFQAASASQESTRVAKQSMIAAERPWIDVTVGEIERFVFGGGYAVLRVPVQLANAGKSPATDIEVIADVCLVQSEVFSRLESYISDAKAGKPWPYPVKTRHVFPNKTEDVDIRLSVKQSDFEAAIASKEVSILFSVVGQVFYRSIFSDVVCFSPFIVDVIPIDMNGAKVIYRFDSDGDQSWRGVETHPRSFSGYIA